MKQKFGTFLTSCLIALVMVIAGRTHAANDTWVGAGADANWGTGSNWLAGTAPVNNDNLVFGLGNQQTNNNTLNNLTVGFVAFTNSGFTLSGNPLTLNPTTAGIFTNTSGTNTITANLVISPAGKYWAISPGTELRLKGTVTNTSASGTSTGFIFLTNGGTLRIMNLAQSTRGMDLFQGTVIVDGGLFDANNDGIRFKVPAGQTVTTVITNNGIWRVGGGGNYRMGDTGSQAGSLSQLIVASGTLELYGPSVTLYVSDRAAAPAVVTQNGGLVWGSAGSGNTVAFGNAANPNGTYNLNGGTLWIAQVKQINSGANTFNFNGGTLKPTVNTSTFFQGVDKAYVQSGGAIIDTTNLAVTIAQNLLAGTGSGGLTKLGSGTLTLSGANTYSGPTVVSNGILNTSASSFLGGGNITIASNASVYVPFNGTSLSASALNLGSSVTNSITLDFGSSPVPNQSVPVVSVGTLNATDTSLINIAGANFTPGTYPLIAFTSASGLGSIQLGTYPLGLSASLVQNGNVLYLNVALVPKNLEWRGAVNANWDTSTTNWIDLNNGGVAASYYQSGNSGDEVTFDDNGSITSINLSGTVTPSQWTMNNNVSYLFSGTGKVSGSVSLFKSSASSGILTIDTANDFTGGSTLQAGTIYVGNNQALGLGRVMIDGNVELASDSVTPRALANAVTLTTNATFEYFGDGANTGAVTINGTFDFGSFSNRTLNFNSDFVLGGPIQNTGGGGFTTVSGSGRFIIRGNGTGGGLVMHTGANFIVDGGTFINTDGWRMAAYNGISLLFAVTNGGSFIMTNTTTANFRVGYTGDPSANNTVDLAGMMRLYGTAGNGSLVMGQSSAYDTLNLRSGGTLICNAITQNGSGVSTLNFYGGTLMPIGSSTTFMQGLTNAFIYDGLTIDTTNFNLTVAEPLQAGGAGGLTKNGSGILTLTGSNTYAGPTIVNAGKLILTPAFSSPGTIMVNTNAIVAFQQPTSSSTVIVAGVSTSSGTNSILEADLAGMTTPVAAISNLTLNGTVGVNVAGLLSVGEFPLFRYGTISGPGNLVLAQLPQGTVATLTTNTAAKTIDLVVSSVAQTIWTGKNSTNWDTVTTNWTLLGSPVAYSQLASVLFSDSSTNPTVGLTGTLTPSSVTVSNNSEAYQFGGAGSLAGSMSVFKYGTNSLSLGTSNTFSGNVTIGGGSLILANGSALGSTANPVYVTNGGTLDINGNAPALEPVYVSGAGVNGEGALVNFGPDQNNAYRNITLTGDTTVGGTGLVGLRTIADSDPGLIASGYKLTKVGSGEFNINGGTTVAGLTNVWTMDLGNVDIQQGTLSFERRSALGLLTNLITVEPGATLRLYSLNQSLPAPPNNIVLTNATLLGNGANAGDVNTLAGQITLNGPSNSISSIGGTYLTLNGPLTGNGGANFSGTVNLGGTNTYTGNTLISGGTLFLEYGAQLVNSPDIFVGTNATLDVSAIAPWTLGVNQTLAGVGSVNGSVTANGTIAPGSPNGVLTFNNDLALNGITLIDVDKTNGLASGTIQVNGSLTYGGQLQVKLVGGTPLAVNDAFQIFGFGAAPGGNFTSVSLPAGYTWDTSQLSVNGTISVSAIVPSTPPAITRVSTSGNSIVFSGTNGTSGASYVVLSSTNASAPLQTWTPVQTNSFDVSGNFSVTNTISPAQPSLFFTVKLQ